jgi:hypothetical protein
MGRILSFLAAVAFASALASALDESLTIGSMLSWLVTFSALFGPMYLFPRHYAEWTRRCRLPRFLRPHG